MAPAILKLHEKFSELHNSFVAIRLLTLSDGIIHDPNETKTAAADLVRKLGLNHLTINSHAVRLFTSSSQPETTAISSLLQLNNVIKPQLVDICSSKTND